jgi:hypothetical protein
LLIGGSQDILDDPQLYSAVWIFLNDTMDQSITARLVRLALDVLELGVVFAWLGVTNLPSLISQFLNHQEHAESDSDSNRDICIAACSIVKLACP